MSNRASAQQCEYFPIVGGNWNNAADARLMSYLAYAKHCNAHNTTQAILDELVLIRRHPEPHP